MVKNVYSPVNVNATLHCAVNNTNLAWEVDGLALDSPVERSQEYSKVDQVQHQIV